MHDLHASLVRQSARIASALALPALAFFGCTLMASAQSAGFDLFQTGTGASVDLSSIGLGTVNLNGVPIQSATGNTDTMMQRSNPSGNNIPLNMYALFLKSATPVTYQGQAADVYITVNNTGTDVPQSTLPQVDTLSPSTGSITLNSDGTFDSNMTINADCIIVKTGGNPANSGDIIGHQPAPPIPLNSSGSPWSTSPPTGYPVSTKYPPGGFYGRPKHKGPHPVIPGSCGGTLAPQTSAMQRADYAIAVCQTQAQPIQQQPQQPQQQQQQ